MNASKYPNDIRKNDRLTPALTRKLNAITASGKHVKRLITVDEADILCDITVADLSWNETCSDWFHFADTQVFIAKRPCGQHVIWA